LGSSFEEVKPEAKIPAHNWHTRKPSQRFLSYGAWVFVGFALLVVSRPKFAASLGEDTEFVAGNIEWDMSKTALACEQKAIRRKICERWHQAFPNDLRSFDHIAPLVDHAKGQVAFEIPLLPQFHQVVAKGAVF
jgi:hypothetical protein